MFGAAKATSIAAGAIELIDTSTASGRFFFHVMASLAEMERELTVERTPGWFGGGKVAGAV